MPIYDSRKKVLADAVGKDGCIVESSCLAATLQNLTGELVLYPDDIEFLYKDRGCYNATTTPTGVVISANGLEADVMKDGIKIGTTDSVMIPLTVGSYVVSIEKEGYTSQALSFVVYADQITSKSITLVKKSSDTGDETEIPTDEKKGAILQQTNNTKMPNPIVTGVPSWFGWEFKSIGDVAWKGMIGVRLKDTEGNILFEWGGDKTKIQTIGIGETKYLWAYCTVTGTGIDDNTKIFGLLTPTN